MTDSPQQPLKSRTTTDGSKSLCVVAFNAFAAVFPHLGKNVGGLETFGWNFAKAVAARTGVQVSFLMRHTELPPQSVVDDVRLLTLVERWREWRREVSERVDVQPSFPWLKVRSWSLRLLWQIPLLALVKLLKPPTFRDQLRTLLDPASDSVLLALAVSNESAALLAVAQERQQTSLLWLQSNADLEPRFFREDSFADVHGVTSSSGRTALSSASHIIAQTEWQRAQVKELIGRDAVLIRNPIVIERFERGPDDPTQRDFVLWIGRFDRHHKRPHLAFEIARACPDIRFLMVINRGDPAIEAETRATRPANVEFVSYVPWNEMPDLYRSARLFLSTGSASYEGFPNVFLEASACGTPVVSLEDFDDYITRSGGGRCSNGNVGELAIHLNELWQSTDAWHSASRAGAEFVRREHSMERVIDQFLALLK